MDSTDDLREPIKRIKSSELPSLTKERVIQAIDDEPELPGVMSHKIYLSVKDDEMALAELLRITVRETKQGIRDRISALCSEPDINKCDACPNKEFYEQNTAKVMESVDAEKDTEREELMEKYGVTEEMVERIKSNPVAMKLINAMSFKVNW